MIAAQSRGTKLASWLQPFLGIDEDGDGAVVMDLD